MIRIEQLKTGWTALKIIRVALGGLFLYSSIQSGHVGGMVAGGIFTIVALFTAGVCCTGAGCYTGSGKNNSSTPENTDYEELDNE